MLNKIIHFSLSNRLLIIVLSILMIFVGGYRMLKLPVDVLPDMNRPRVTVMTECSGYAPEEVEMLITTPIETALNGAAGVTAIRSSSTVGLSMITVEFDWNVDSFKSRQIVSERLQLASEQLPGFIPRMSPISSVMGQILTLSIQDESGKMSPMRLRMLADWTIRRQLLGLTGISEIYVMGGDSKQYQIQVRTDDLIRYGTTLDEIVSALEKNNRNVTGGYLTGQGSDQILVRSLGRIESMEELRQLVVKENPTAPVLLHHIADIISGSAIKVGSSSAHIKNKNGQKQEGEAVVLTIEKQPDQDTRILTDKILEQVKTLEKQIQQEYPGFRIKPLYQQKTFISLAISNVIEALWTGAILVTVVLILFLLNIRATVITLIAIPLSIIITCLIFALFGLSINTMTLGGLAVAIGELVDDAIVDVENIFRRLREFFQGSTASDSKLGDSSSLKSNTSELSNQNVPDLSNSKSSKLLNTNVADSLKINAAESANRNTVDFEDKTTNIVFKASSEIRNSIVFGTIIVVLVFFPLFWLSGIEGKLFAPLGIAYVVSILSSLMISLTLTPVLASFLLPKSARTHRNREGLILKIVKKGAEFAVRFSLRFPKTVLGLALLAIILTLFLFLERDRDFIRSFNEGALQINVDLLPGKSLETSSELTDHLAAQLLDIDGIESVVRKTGRSEFDEHAVPVNTSELVCSLDTSSKRTMNEILDDVQRLIDKENLPGTVAFYDQPLQHLINHLRSGTRSKIAVKLRGDDPALLRQRAREIVELLKDIPDIGNLRIDPSPNDIPQVRIQLKRDRLALYGLTADQVLRTFETAMNGTVATTLWEERMSFDVLVRLSDQYRENLAELRRLPIQTQNGQTVLLEEIAEINEKSRGPSQIDHEAGRPQVMIQTNPRNRGAVDVKEDIEKKLAPHLKELQANNVEIELAGLFESEQTASRIIFLTSMLSLLGVFLALYSMFRSVNLSLQIMGALPLALFGAVLAMIWTDQPRTIPILVGMISLCGIASRNGILLMDHYFHLVRFEGETFSKSMLIRAAKDRVAPVLMTALTSAIGLIPLTLTPDEPGREILYPIATVVVGGLLTSTLLEFFVRPALFWTFGRKAAKRALIHRR